MKTLGLALAAVTVAAALLAACGPSVPPVAPEPGATAPPVTAAAPVVAPTVTVTAPAPVAPAGNGNSTPLDASKFVEQARKLGVDFKRPLAQIPLASKKKLMPLFMKSLGYESCAGCHVEGDFKTETRNLKIARQMWDRFVVALRDAKGAPVFCDSCHAGKPKNLDRGDLASLKRFMAVEYAGKLTRGGADSAGCATCHGYPFEGRIIEKAWGIAAK